jgi:hypothetical protein
MKTNTTPPITLHRLDLNHIFSTIPPDPDYVLPGMLSKTVGLIVGAGSTGKSMWSVQVGMSIAAGSDLFNILGGDPVKGRVVYLCAEDQEAVLHARLYSMAEVLRDIHRDKADAFLSDISNAFDVLPVYGMGIAVTGRPKENQDYPWGTVTDYCDGARLIIVDTLIRFAGGQSENDNVAMSNMMNIVEQTVRATGASFLLLHHVGKQSAREGTAGADQTATRGASSLTDNARWQGNLQTMTVADGEKRGLEGEERRRWVSFEATKTNYGPPQAAIWLYRGRSGILGQASPPEVSEGGGGRF